MKPLPSTPLPVELFATNDQCRTGQFDFDDQRQIDPYAGDPPAKRKGTETARVLAILESLERGNG